MQKKFYQRLQTSPVGAWILLPLTLFLGVTFAYAGLQKLTDPQFFAPTRPGYIGNQIMAFARNSPIHDVLINLVLPHVHFFGLLIAYGELAIGIGTLLGFLLRPAAFFGMLLSILFFLSASWHTYPYFYGSDIVFTFCWLTLLISGPYHTGLPAIDTWLAPRLLSLAPEKQQKWVATALFILLGVKAEEEPQTAQVVKELIASTISASGKLQGQRQSTAAGNRQPSKQTVSVYKAQQALLRRQENRRNFLVGLVSGGAAMLGITLLWNVLHPSDSSVRGGSGNGDTSGGTATTTATTTPPTTGTPTTSNVIAQISAVPTNSSTTFTIPSSGDPGVLIHLDTGQFVAYDALCTHAGCPVDYDPSSKLLLCPCHGAQFDPAKSAAAIQGPTNTPLPSVAIRVDSVTGAIIIL